MRPFDDEKQPTYVRALRAKEPEIRESGNSTRAIRCEEGMVKVVVR